MQLELFTPAKALTVFRTQIQDRMEDLQEDSKQLIDQGHFEKAQGILQQVQALKGDQLNTHDLDNFADGKTIHWRNTAQWARNTLREEGLLRDDIPRGVWGISEAGRKWLKAQSMGK